MYVQNLPNFSVFSKFCQYLCSELGKKILANHIHLEAMHCYSFEVEVAS